MSGVTEFDELHSVVADMRRCVASLRSHIISRWVDHDGLTRHHNHAMLTTVDLSRSRVTVIDIYLSAYMTGT